MREFNQTLTHIGLMSVGGGYHPTLPSPTELLMRTKGHLGKFDMVHTLTFAQSQA